MGKDALPTTQARHWFAEALVSILLAKSDDEKLEIALCFPLMKTYVDLINRIGWARRKLRIYCYLVDDYDQVHSFHPSGSYLLK